MFIPGGGRGGGRHGGGVLQEVGNAAAATACTCVEGQRLVLPRRPAADGRKILRGGTESGRNEYVDVRLQGNEE